MKFWKPAGPAAFELGAYRGQKDWSSGLWDIYQNGVHVGSNFDGAVEAMDEAERMGA